MIGAINKYLRKVAAIKGKSEFENRLIKATYNGDMKEAKEKHVLFILSVLKGNYHELIHPREALEKLLDTLFSNLKSISSVNKVLSILHRSLQDEMISEMIAVKMKEKENILFSCIRDQDAENSDDIRMQIHVSDLYIEYIKSLVNFVCVCQLFTIRLSDLLSYSESLKVQELFKIFNKIDLLIEHVFRLFEQRNFCKRYRLFQNIIFLVFIDLGRIYQSYYLLITSMLGKITRMEVIDCKRAYLAYSNFVKINKEIRHMAACVVGIFNQQQQNYLRIDFYDVDGQVFDNLLAIIHEKQRMEDSKSARATKSSQGQGGGGGLGNNLQIQQAQDAINESLCATGKLFDIGNGLGTGVSPLKGFLLETPNDDEEPVSPLRMGDLNLQQQQLPSQPKLREQIEDDDRYKTSLFIKQEEEPVDQLALTLTKPIPLSRDLDPVVEKSYLEELKIRQEETGLQLKSPRLQPVSAPIAPSMVTKVSPRVSPRLSPHLSPRISPRISPRVSPRMMSLPSGNQPQPQLRMPHHQQHHQQHQQHLQQQPRVSPQRPRPQQLQRSSMHSAQQYSSQLSAEMSPSLSPKVPSFLAAYQEEEGKACFNTRQRLSKYPAEQQPQIGMSRVSLSPRVFELDDDEQMTGRFKDHILDPDSLFVQQPPFPTVQTQSQFEQTYMTAIDQEKDNHYQAEDIIQGLGSCPQPLDEAVSKSSDNEKYFTALVNDKLRVKDATVMFSNRLSGRPKSNSSSWNKEAERKDQRKTHSDDARSMKSQDFSDHVLHQMTMMQSQKKSKEKRDLSQNASYQSTPEFEADMAVNKPVLNKYSSFKQKLKSGKPGADTLLNSFQFDDTLAYDKGTGREPVMELEPKLDPPETPVRTSLNSRIKQLSFNKEWHPEKSDHSSLSSEAQQKKETEEAMSSDVANSNQPHSPTHLESDEHPMPAPQLEPELLSKAKPLEHQQPLPDQAEEDSDSQEFFDC